MSDEQAKPVTEEELATLPHWAVVAFAVRCARRVQPLFDLPEEHLERWRHLVAVDEAIAACEHWVDVTSFGRGSVGVLKDAAFADFYAAAAAAADTARGIGDSARSDTRSGAADSAAFAAFAIFQGDNSIDSAAVSAARAVVCAEFAVLRHGSNTRRHAKRLANEGFGGLADVARIDFLRLQALVASTTPLSWNFSEAGPLGSLWPDGPPEWYPAAKERMDRLLVQAREELAKETAGADPAAGSSSVAELMVAAAPLSLYFDLAEFTPEQIEEQIAALADLYHAVSDDELRIVGRTFLSPSLVPVEG